MDRFLSEMHSDSRERLFPAVVVFITLFFALQDCALVLYGSTFLILAYLSWQAAKIIKRFFPGKRVSPYKKVVLITGCDTGFGHALAKTLYDQGYTVMAACLNPQGEGAESLRSSHPTERMHVFGMDVTRDEDVEEAVKDIKSKLVDGRQLWAVVNNAGVGVVTPIVLSDISEHEKMIAVNQLGVVRVTKAFLPLLRQSRGRLILVASIAGRMSFPLIVPYSMTKHAVVALADGLRRELGDWGVKIITIEPALYRTGIIPDEDQIRARLEKQWQEADPELRDLYPRGYLDDLISRTVQLAKSANPDIGAVVQAMADSVSLQDPDIANRVATPFDRFGLWLHDVSPRFLQDLVVFLSVVAR